MRYRALRGCVAASLMFIVCAVAESKEPQRTNPETQKPGNITQQTTPPPIVVNVSPPQKTIEEIEREAKEREEKSDLDRKLVKLTGDLANYTFALFAATVALVLATACLGIFGWKQSRDMKDSIAVAKESADAAKRSAEITEKAFTLLERPYVIPEDVGDLRPIQYFGTVSGFVQFQIGNYGKVPAIVHRVTARFAMIELPVTQEKLVAPNYSPGETRADGWVLSKVLMSGAIHQLPQSVVPDGMQKVEIEIVQGRARPKGVPQHAFFLSIWIEYEDAANGTMRHAVTLWELGLAGFARYGGKKYNYERQIDA
jgi:hypothetical protein